MARRIEVTVHTGASRPRVEDRAGGLEVWVGARPVEGAANAAVLEAVAGHLGVRLSTVRLVAGARSRKKLLEVS